MLHLREKRHYHPQSRATFEDIITENMKIPRKVTLYFNLRAIHLDQDNAKEHFAKLRQVEALVGQDPSRIHGIRWPGIVEQICYS